MRQLQSFGMLRPFGMFHLPQAVETLRPDELDQLPFGVVKLDSFGIIQFRNRIENEFFPQKESVLGRPFTDVAPFLNNDFVSGRIEKARAAVKLDIAFNYVTNSQEVTLGVQSASDGGIWIFSHAVGRTKFSVGPSFHDP